MYIFDIANQQASLAIDEDFLREVATATMEAEEVAAAEVSIALVDNPTMRELNIRHLQHDYDTDVLSFLFEAHGGRWTPADPQGRRGAGKRIEGEIIISADMACDMAQDFGWSPREELLLYLVHGLLHLAGYDDQSESEQALMRSRERTILSRWNLAPHYADAETEGPDQTPGETNSSSTHTEGRP